MVSHKRRPSKPRSYQNLIRTGSSQSQCQSQSPHDHVNVKKMTKIKRPRFKRNAPSLPVMSLLDFSKLALDGNRDSSSSEWTVLKKQLLPVNFRRMALEEIEYELWKKLSDKFVMSKEITVAKYEQIVEHWIQNEKEQEQAQGQEQSQSFLSTTRDGDIAMDHSSDAFTGVWKPGNHRRGSATIKYSFNSFL